MATSSLQVVRSAANHRITPPNAQPWHHLRITIRPLIRLCHIRPSASPNCGLFRMTRSFSSMSQSHGPPTPPKLDLHAALRAGKTDVDCDGNTLFHRAAVDGSEGLRGLDRIAQLGVDFDQPNHTGRHPLHALCSVGHYDEFLAPSFVEQTRWMLRRTGHVDVADADGIRPLHLAAMMSEFLVKELLAAGANIQGCTKEGLSPLHLAARARQSNVVGMLIQDAEARGILGPCLDLRDDTGRAPLHYACRSGRHESVGFLLDAGANPEAKDHRGMTPLDTCCEFEDEQRLWEDYHKPDKWDWDLIEQSSVSRSWNEVAVAGCKLHDELRPWVLPGRAVKDALDYYQTERGIRSAQDTARLDEILQLLFVSHTGRGHAESKPAFVEALGRCIRTAETNGHSYTLRCLKHMETKLAGVGADETSRLLTRHDEDVINTLDRRDKYGISPSTDYDVAMIDQLLRRREYGTIESLLYRHSCSTPEKTAETGLILCHLAKHGFFQLLTNILASDDAPSISAVEESLKSVSADPLLYEACQRELPNMDVVRLLVEKAGVDMNSKSRTTKERAADLFARGFTDEEDVDPGANTALHQLALGRHWWGVVQAIPYLLAQGADCEQRNEAGESPLQVAVNSLPRETFVDQAAKALQFRDRDVPSRR